MIKMCEPPDPFGGTVFASIASYCSDRLLPMQPGVLSAGLRHRAHRAAGKIDRHASGSRQQRTIGQQLARMTDGWHRMVGNDNIRQRAGRGHALRQCIGQSAVYRHPSIF